MKTAEQAAAVPPKRSRIEIIDVVRGIALLAMAVYHFSWDLEFFGYVEPGTVAFGNWKIFARCIASSFLLLVGISLYLANGRGIRWRPFLIRLAQVGLAAAAITAVTWFAFPSGFIFFGILHEIALASLLGLAFLRVPALVTAAVAVLVVALPQFARSQFFDHPALWWVGLSSIDPRSNDYVPVFPWFGAVLFGVAAARFADRLGILDRLARFRAPGTAPLRFIGRHSLAFYLIHQPFLIGCVWALSQVHPPEVAPPDIQFTHACQAQCRNVRDEPFCVRYCGCMLEEMEQAGIAGRVYAEEQSADLTETLQGLAGICTARTDEEIERRGPLP